MNDNIKAYVMTPEAGICQRCPTCSILRPVWVGETEGGDTLTCCSSCQRVLRRQVTNSIPALSVN